MILSSMVTRLVQAREIGKPGLGCFYPTVPCVDPVCSGHHWSLHMFGVRIVEVREDACLGAMMQYATT